MEWFDGLNTELGIRAKEAASLRGEAEEAAAGRAAAEAQLRCSVLSP
jgi:hypothetical protein